MSMFDSLRTLVMPPPGAPSLVAGPTPRVRPVAAEAAAPRDHALLERPLTHEVVFAPGRAVGVLRSSGAREEGWLIEGVLPDGRVRVRSGDLVKDCASLRLLMQNPRLLDPQGTLSVRRSSGAVEEGWQVAGVLLDGRLLMERGELSRPCTLEDLVQANPHLLPPAAVSQLASTPAPQAPRPPAEPAPASAATAATPLGPLQSATLLARTVFEPNPLGIRPMGAGDLTAGFLHARGLGPAHTVHEGATRIHVSRPFSHGGQRTAMVAYVEGPDGKVHVRTFYRSNSQGLWRSASHCGMNGWIGKGTGEESTNLPIPLQKTLSTLGAAPPVEGLQGNDAETAFYGNLPMGGHLPPPRFQEEVQVAPFGSFAQATPDGPAGDPGSFRYARPGDAPDFNRREDSYAVEHPSRGSLQAHVFRSQDGQQRYLFLEDRSGRSWLGAVEVADSPLTTYGVHRQSWDSGSLTMPAVEYGQQIPAGYAGAHVQGSYYDASAYTHRLPPVAAWLQARPGRAA